MGWRFYDEAIEMLQRRFGYLPRMFSWRGRCYEVDRVERCWERRRRGRRPARRFFRVMAGNGTYELYRDLEVGTWYLRRARLHPATMPVARTVLRTRSVPVWSGSARSAPQNPGG